MNVLAKTKRCFPAPIRVNGVIQRHPQFQEFLRSWNMLLASPTEQIYNQKLAEMQAKYPTSAVKILYRYLANLERESCGCLY